MRNQPTFRYTRVREVKALTRANVGDAGIDFYFPTNITVEELINKLADQVKATHGVEIIAGDYLCIPGNNTYSYVNGQGQRMYRSSTDKDYHLDIYNHLKDEIVTGVTLKPGARVLIPSGIKALLTPMNSMLMAANKSGVSTKKGLVYGAEIVDSPYVGEIHISLINTSVSEVTLKAGEKVVQFIHVPIYNTDPEEIPTPLYDQVAETWGTRGDGAFGSSDKEEELAIIDAQLSGE